MRIKQLKEEFAEYYFDKKAAGRVVRFFEKELRHVKGGSAGEAFILQPWQKKILRRLFGWKSRETKLRKYKTLYLEIPRKNGKSALGAGLALYLLDADGVDYNSGPKGEVVSSGGRGWVPEASAEVISAAADTEQAAIVFETAKQMVNANPKMGNRMQIFKRSMVVHATASTYKVVSAEASTKHGANLSAVIVDELHAQPDRELVDVLITSMAYRTQPMSIFLTTAGYDKNSICWEYHDYAERVRKGIIKDPTFLGYIYSAEPGDDWKLESTWRKANPNYGITVQPAYIKEQAQKASEVIAYENTFKRLHLNIWTEQDSRWLPIEKWDACESTFALEELEGMSCIAGVDLATTTDVTAVSLIFPWPDGTYRHVEHFFVPEEAISIRARRDRVPYDVWTQEGLFHTTPGAVCDYDFIRESFREWATRYKIQQIVIDRWNATQLATQLQGDGFEVAFFGQGFASMSAPMKELNSLILANKIHHRPNAVMRWMVSNVAIEQDAAGNIKPSKRRSKEKIDGVVALVNALGVAIATPKKEESIYSSRGVLAL
jgi:phage terminase large subunit-like protein